MAASGPIPFDAGRPDASFAYALFRKRVDRATSIAPRWAGSFPAHGSAGRFGDIGAIAKVRALDAPGRSVPVGIAVNNGVLPRAVYQPTSTRFAAFPVSSLPGVLVPPAPPVVPFRDISADVRQVRRRSGG